MSHTPSASRVAHRAMSAAVTREYAVVVEGVHGDDVVVRGRGSGHAGLERGMMIPSRWLPAGRPSVGDEFFASWTPGPNGGKWSFAELDFNIV